MRKKTAGAALFAFLSSLVFSLPAAAQGDLLRPVEEAPSVVSLPPFPPAPQSLPDLESGLPILQKEVLVTAPLDAALSLFQADAADWTIQRYLPERLQDFISEQVVPREALYFQPNLGTDENTGMPYDHIRIRLKSQMLGETGHYTAASKLSLLMPYLLGVIQEKPVFKKSGLAPAAAEKILLRILKTLSDYNQKYPDYGGFLPWVDIRPNGTIAPASGKMPALDNGQMTWALAALTATFENSDSAARREIADLAQKLLLRQDYRFFYDAQAGLLHGTIQKDPVSGVWTGDTTYYLNDMFEGMLAVLWAVLHGQVPESVWYQLDISTVDYLSSGGEKVTTFQGFRASFHEHWALGYLPLMESALAPLYHNFLFVQADYARQRKMPGFIGTAYDPRGNYRQMGVPEISKNPVDRSDVAVLFATAMGMLIAPGEGAAWLKRLYELDSMVSPYGAVESMGPDGFADIFTADAKGMTLLAVSGGIVPEVAKYLRARTVPQSGISMDVKFIELLHAKALQMIGQRGGRPFYMPEHYDLKPPAETVRIRHQPLWDPGDTWNISERLQRGHLHGKNVRSPGRATLEDDIRPGEKIAFEFEIPAYYPYFDQWAFRGTYLDKAAKIASMRYLTLEIPAGKPPLLFELELKSDDMTLATVIIDTTTPGLVSKDGRWKTLYPKLQIIPEAEEKAFNYLSVAVHDPRYLLGKFAAYGRQGEIQIRNLQLSRKDPLGGMLEMLDWEKNEDRERLELIRYWRMSHGALGFMPSPEPGALRFSGGLGWRGGYLPYTDLSQFQAIYLKLRNLTAECNCLNVELKHESDSLVGYKVPVRLAADTEWHVYKVEIPGKVRKALNYLAFSDPIAPFELASVALAYEPFSDQPVISVPAPGPFKKPVRCQYRCFHIAS